MEVEAATNLLPRPALYSDDHLRLPRSLRIDDHERPRAASENRRMNGDSVHIPNAFEDSPPRNDENAIQTIRPDGALLSLDETTQLFRTKIEDARKEREKEFEGSEEVADAVRPTLTLDLGHSNIARLPETVVDLIKAEVERLSLSHNQIWHIPLRFSECSHLRYLNIRTNVFREIPRGVYKLPLLEILDISRNKVRRISKEIKYLTSLKVFSIVHNRVDDLPFELCEMPKLQILKIAENPLRFKLKKIVEAKENEVSFSELTENEREAAVTAEIKRHLRELHPVVTPVDIESGGEFSEGLGDTPKPFKRVMSSRFPVVPSNHSTSSETMSDSVTRSPGQTRPPPIPTRSHHRMTSGQNVPALRRPGIAPLINNERNRSNSESVLQASMAARSKRMGMLRKEKSELDPVDEKILNRQSHLRGLSHASVLRSRNGSLPSPGGPKSSSPQSPRDARRQRQAFVKRLSSLPEHKIEADWRNPVIDGAKGILYALYQVHPQISGLIAAIKGKDQRRSSLEFTFYNASTHVDRLNEAIESADSLDDDDEEALEKAEETVQQDCATCIMAYTHVAAQLQDSVRKIVAGTDARYVRTLMLLLYGSMIEVKNAISSFGVEVETLQEVPAAVSDHRFQTIPEEISTPQQSIRAATPTRDRSIALNRQGGRLRSETTIQHPGLEDFIAYPPNPPFAQDQLSLKLPSQPPTPLTGSTLQGGTYHKSMQSYASNGSSQDSTIRGTIGLRSRSNSRNASNFASNASSLAPSLVGTPRSGEVFHLPPPSAFATRINPVTGLTDAQEESVFEQIFLALTRAYESALQYIPIVQRKFVRYLEMAEESRQPKEIRELWGGLLYRCQESLNASETLKSRLINMRLMDPVVTINGAGSGRNDPAFWQLCTMFISSFVGLATEMKEAKDLRLLPSEIVVILRPVQKASQVASKLIDTSPWRQADVGTGAVQPPPSYIISGNAFANGINGSNRYSSTMQQHHSQHSPFPPPVIPVPPLPNGTAATNGASPILVPLPATPLSAALGPAAQATIPSTPSIGNGEQFFQGNVFQRADTLLSMPLAGNMNFLNRR